MIEAIVSAVGGEPGEGDDIAVLKVGSRYLGVKVDMMVEGTDMPRGMTFRQAARKSVAACVSDFASKGVRPRSFLASVGVRKGTPESQAVELGLGFDDAQKEWGARLVGGDTNETEQLIIDVAMFGWGNRLVQRKGAQPRDVLVVTGRFGLPPSGLRILSGKTRATSSFRRTAVRSALEPSPNLEAGLAVARHLTSSMDSSDGLARSLHSLARAGGVGFEVDTLPYAKGVEDFASSNGLDSRKLVLEGGEEYVVVGTVPEGDFDEAERAARRHGGTLIPIGRATARKGTVVSTAGGRKTKVRDAGWTHLRGG